MISVIISTHDGRLELLKRAVQSVINQSYTDWELIIVDDASKDGTEAWCKSLTDKRIQYVRRTNNFGCDTLPKNRGTKASKGEYIAYLDSDNEYRKDHLQALYNVISKDKELDVVYGDRMVHIPTGETQMGIASDFNAGLLMMRNFIDTSDVLIKREALFSVGGWDERYTKYVDWNLWVRMTKAGKRFKRVPLIITDYYIHDQQKSATVKSNRDDLEKGQFIPEWDWWDVEIDLPYLHTPKEIKVAVFSLVKDRWDYTKTCFNSLREKAGYNFDHYIVDQGSTDGVRSWVERDYTHTDMLRNAENVGISLGSNQAIDRIMKEDYDIIIKYDPDCLSLTHGWIKEIVELYKRNMMMCLSPYPEGLRDNPGGAPRINYWKVNKHLIGITNHLGGFCHVAPSSVYKKFRWDDKQPLHGIQDLELSQWLNKNGYLMGYVEDLRVEHYEGTDGQHKRYPEYFELRKKEKVTFYDKNRK